MNQIPGAVSARSVRGLAGLGALGALCSAPAGSRMSAHIVASSGAPINGLGSACVRLVLIHWRAACDIRRRGQGAARRICARRPVSGHRGQVRLMHSNGRKLPEMNQCEPSRKSFCRAMCRCEWARPQSDLELFGGPGGERRAQQVSRGRVCVECSGLRSGLRSGLASPSGGRVRGRVKAAALCRQVNLEARN